MLARTHNAIAFASLVTVAAIYPPNNINSATMVASVIGVCVGALIPDMDQAGNNLWDLFPGGSMFGSVFRRIFYKHRTLTHSALGVFLIYNFLYLLFFKIFNPEFLNPGILLSSVMIGYLSHLISDAFTEEGLPILFPLRINFGFPPIKSWRIKTGQWFENIVIFPGIWIYLVWFVNLNKDILLAMLRVLV